MNFSRCRDVYCRVPTSTVGNQPIRPTFRYRTRSPEDAVSLRRRRRAGHAIGSDCTSSATRPAQPAAPDFAVRKPLRLGRDWISQPSCAHSSVCSYKLSSHTQAVPSHVQQCSPLLSGRGEANFSQSQCASSTFEPGPRTEVSMSDVSMSDDPSYINQTQWHSRLNRCSSN